MKKLLYFILFFQSFFLYSQQLENDIYTAIDNFAKSKSKTSLAVLSIKEAEFVKKISTKKEQLALVILQCNKGYYLKEIQQLKKAIISYEKAWKLFSDHQLKNYDIIEYCLKPLGNLYTKTKDYTNAENIIKHYLFLAEREQKISQKIAGIINLSKVYQSVGKHKVVIGLINNSLKIKGISIFQKEKLENIKLTSILFLKESNIQLTITNYYISYKVALKEGNYKKALHYFKLNTKTIAEKDVSNRKKAKLHVEEAQLYYLLEQKIKAKKSLNKALGLLLPLNSKDTITTKILYGETTFIDIFDAYALLENNDKEALKNYEFSFYVANLLEESTTSQEAKIIYQSEKRKRSEKCIELLLKLYEKTKDKTYFIRAFYYAEKGKSFVLKEQLGRKKMLDRFPNDSLLKKEKKLLKHQEKLTNTLVKQQVMTRENLVVNQLNKELHIVSVALKKVQLQIKQKYTSVQKNKASVKEIQKKLKDTNAILIKYFYGKRYIYQFIISAKNIYVYPIKLTQKIENTIVNYIRFFKNASAINNNIKNFTQQAFLLYKSLLFHKALNNKNVVLITDGLLNFIPFETLLIKPTTTTNFTKMPFVVKHQNITYNASSIFFLMQKKIVNIKKIAGFFPVFKGTNKELEHSVIEAKSIKEQRKSKVLMYENATKNNFIKLALNYNILHLSTHASGGDFTTSANIEFYQKKLTLNELYGLDIAADLVVLSACETGIGELKKGEGAISIARGFQYAGVNNVLFTLWKINDKSTALLIKYFYRFFTKNKSVSYANHQSKLAYINNVNIKNSKKSPYYWGAFVYYGAINEPINNKFYFYILGVVTVIIISLAFVFCKMKK